METLFSFELLVDSIRMDVKTKVSDELAVALRLLDFPTLIIYQPEHKTKEKEEGEFTFNKGKACFFKLNMDFLHSHLSNTPLYAMVLDVKEEIPKFVGSSLISLAKLMNKIRLDVTERGFSTPSSHGQRGIVSISNLTGEKVGTISLSYKLLSLGSGLISQVNTSEVQCLKDVICEKEAHKKPLDSENIHSSKVDQDGESRRPQSEASTKHEIYGSTCQVTCNSSEEDTSVFCPPQLYYNNSAEERQKYKEESHKLKKIDLGAFAFEDSEDDGDTHVHSSVKEQSHNVKPLSQEKQQVSSEVTPNVIGEALRQMPLLNALLVELSQLNTVNTNQSISVHPNLAGTYRPASTEQMEGQTNTLRHRHVASPNLEETHRKNTPRKKLVYGTTKTSNLRLKRNSPAVGKCRECVGLIQSKMQLNANREKSKSTAKSAKRKSTQISNLTENIETMIQSITVESTPQESVTEKLKNMYVCKSVGMLHEDRTSLQEKPLLIESPLRRAQIPAHVESDISLNNSEKINQSHTDGQRRKSSGSSSRSSPDSSVSDHSGEGNEEVDDYADDFTSFEPSEAYSPDPMSSPEPRSRAKTPNSLSAGPDLCQSSDSSSGSVQISRAVLPVPVKASRSPQRVLRGTYTIQHQTNASGVSVSSESGDRDGVTSGLTGHLEKQLTWSSSRSSGESFRSSGGHRTNSKRVLSNGSSLEHRAEEEDEFGTLDFRNGYKHISELVAQKLPGYTM